MAHIKWGLCESELTDSGIYDDLPPEFAECREIWKRCKSKRWVSKRDKKKIISKLQNFIVAWFLPGNLTKGQDQILEKNEIECESVHIVDVFYHRDNLFLPQLCVKVFFNIPFSIHFSDNNALVDWQLKNDYLEHAIYCRFNFQLSDEDFIEIGFRDHRGVEIYGPLPPDDPGLTYAETINGTAKRALKELDEK